MPTSTSPFPSQFPIPRSGILTTPTGDRHIPPSTRADGSLRKEIKIRPGYRPPEDVEVYKNRTAEAWKTRGSGGVPGAEGLKDLEDGKSSTGKNAKRREARKRAKVAEGEEENESLVNAKAKVECYRQSSKDSNPDKDSNPEWKDNGRAEGPPPSQEPEPEPEPEPEMEPEAEKEKQARNLKKKLRQARQLREKKDKGALIAMELRRHMMCDKSARRGAAFRWLTAEMVPEPKKALLAQVFPANIPLRRLAIFTSSFTRIKKQAPYGSSAITCAVTCGIPKAVTK